MQNIQAYTPPAQIQERRKPRSIFEMTNEDIERLKIIAKMYSTSMFNKSGTQMGEGDVFITMMKGIEVGLEPMASIDLIHVIQGKPTISPAGMLALINSTGEVEDIKIYGTDDACTVTMKRKGRTEHSETFTMQNAIDMKLSGKDNYRKQPAVMLKWRAISACARIVFPDVIQGMYTPEEIAPDAQLDSDGNMTLLPTPPKDDAFSGMRKDKPQKRMNTAPLAIVDGTSARQLETDDKLENGRTFAPDRAAMEDAQNAAHWTSDADARGDFLRYVAESGFDNAWAFIQAKYYADRTIKTFEEIADDLETAKARIDYLAGESDAKPTNSNVTSLIDVWNYAAQTLPKGTDIGKYFNQPSVNAESSDDEKASATDLWMLGNEYDYPQAKAQIDKDAAGKA